MLFTFEEADELDDAGMVDASHDLHLFQDVGPLYEGQPVSFGSRTDASYEAKGREERWNVRYFFALSAVLRKQHSTQKAGEYGNSGYSRRSRASDRK